MINVTKTFFPPIEDFNFQVQRIWKNEWLTNRGELVKDLENNISNFLALQDAKLILMNNGTIPLQIALKILGNKGDIITTPFSYVATTSSIIWENCNPVFVDIDSEYLTIDETRIEEAITEKTTCILATHVFGNPCNVNVINKIAKKYKLHVIYDAAHCFGVEYNEKSIFEFGDISTCSFHATKLFHTAEGGGLFVKNKEIYKKCFYSHNFGHDGPLKFHGLGINGKISELQAAMGLSVLPYMPQIIKSRKEVVDFYNSNLDMNKVKTLKIRKNTKWNYSYYPIIFKSENALLKVEKQLNDNNIFPRRYFYPPLNTLPFIKNYIVENSDRISSSVLCLPLSHNLEKKHLVKIIKIVNFIK